MPAGACAQLERSLREVGDDARRATGRGARWCRDHPSGRGAAAEIEAGPTRSQGAPTAAGPRRCTEDGGGVPDVDAGGLGRLSVAAAGPGTHRGVIGVRRSECRLVCDDRLRQRVLFGVPRRRCGPRVVDRHRRHHRRMAVPRRAGRVRGRRLSGVGTEEVRQRLHPRRRDDRWVHRDDRQRCAGLGSRRHACRAHRCRPGRSLRGHRYLAHDGPRRQRKPRLRLQGPVRAGRAQFSLAEPVKREGPLHAIPGGFLANMQAVALGLARRAIDEAIGVVTDKIVLPDGVAIREVPRVREAIADAQRQHRSAQAYASRSIDDAGRNSPQELRSVSTSAST